MIGGAAFPKAVVFDLDGTLVDSAADIARAMNAGFDIMGIPKFTTEDVHRIVGGGAKMAIEKAADAAGIVLSDADRARVTTRFFEKYREVSAEGNGLYPGAKDLLMTLRGRGVRTALCTNKAEPVAHIAVKALGIAELFDVTVGARDDRPRKPFPDMIHACIDPVGVSPADAVMIGDSRADAEAARAAGLPVILTSFGYSTTPVADLRPDAIVDHLDEVIGLLPGVLARSPRLRV
jgi:phosphoglycolate phosphatase